MKRVSVSSLDVATDQHKLIIIIGADTNLTNEIHETLTNLHCTVIINPENDLHPEEQCRCIELITAGLRNVKDPLYLFTNSPYIVDHLTNLMMADKFKGNRERERTAKGFFTETPDAFISYKDVSAYGCDDGEIARIGVSKNGRINWRTFSEISEYIVDLYFELEEDYEPYEEKEPADQQASEDEESFEYNGNVTDFIGGIIRDH